MTTLYDIKVGDWVRRFYDEAFHPQSDIRKVCRITKAQIIVGRGYSEIKFWKKNGRKVGASDWHPSHIEVIK